MAKEACEGEGQVKLLGSSLSPYVLRARIALALKGIDYELIEEDIQNKSHLLLQSNPIYKRVPVLIHKGKPLCESMLIVQYIDEVWDTKAPNLMPKDPYDRAIARFWSTVVDDKLLPALRRVFASQGEQLQKAAEDVVTSFLLIEEALRTNICFSGKSYFGGDEIGFLDISLGPFTSVFLKALQKLTDTVLIDPEQMPLLCAWRDRFCQVNGVKEVLPDPVKELEILSAGRANFTSPPGGN